LSLIYGEFFWLILIAAVLACPAAWYFMHRWLQDFAYRVDITIWPFVFTSLAILLATLVVTMVHVVRAARANPVESLRYE
jgi:putative ABC transport system permease protein